MCIKVGQEVYFRWQVDRIFSLHGGVVVSVSNLNSKLFYTVNYSEWFRDYEFTRKGVSPIITLCA